MRWSTLGLQDRCRPGYQLGRAVCTQGRQEPHEPGPEGTLPPYVRSDALAFPQDGVNGGVSRLSGAWPAERAGGFLGMPNSMNPPLLSAPI